MTVNLTLIRIAMGYGYMRADDILTARRLDRVRYRQRALRLGLERNTDAIVRLQIAIHELRRRFFPAPPPGLLAAMEQQLTTLLDGRRRLGGAVPPAQYAPLPF